MNTKQGDFMRYLLLGTAAYVAANAASKLLKYGLYASLAYVVYTDLKKNGGKLSGNPGGWDMNFDFGSLVSAAFPEMKPHHSALVATAAQRIFERKFR